MFSSIRAFKCVGFFYFKNLDEKVQTFMLVSLDIVFCLCCFWFPKKNVNFSIS